MIILVLGYEWTGKERNHTLYQAVMLLSSRNVKCHIVKKKKKPRTEKKMTFQDDNEISLAHDAA